MAKYLPQGDGITGIFKCQQPLYIVLGDLARDARSTCLKQLSVTCEIASLIGGAFSAEVRWVWLKIKQEGLRRC